MRRRRAVGDVAKRIAQGGELLDLAVDAVGLLVKPGARKVGRTLFAEHARDLIERKARRFAHGDELQMQKHVVRKLPAQPVP